MIFNQSEALDVFVVEGGCLLVCGLRCPLAESRILLQKRLEGLKNLNTELNIEVKVDLKSETLSNDLSLLTSDSFPSEGWPGFL